MFRGEAGKGWYSTGRLFLEGVGIRGGGDQRRGGMYYYVLLGILLHTGLQKCLILGVQQQGGMFKGEACLGQIAISVSMCCLTTLVNPLGQQQQQYFCLLCTRFNLHSVKTVRPLLGWYSIA